MDICPVVIAELVVKLVKETYTVREDYIPNEKEELIAKEILISLHALMTDAQFEEDEVLEGTKFYLLMRYYVS